MTKLDTTVHHVLLEQFDGQDDDERMAAALAWAHAIGEPVVIDIGDAQLTEISIYGLPDITIEGRLL